MSYLVLARKYRPLDFSTVAGQEHITKTLGNLIRTGKIAHAYLFCGPRGIGKTSVARIFSKALNCVKGPTPTPCNQCPNCLEITKGSSLAVREIDGASHSGVENVRELIDSFRSLPPAGSQYKIYIIDEVHMFSTAAFNALLKSIEEPPPHTIFILATTEVHKIPDTVISRCQRHDFRALSVSEIENCLKEIAQQESLSAEPQVFRLLARLADGSLRDAQSLLERIQSFCEGRLTAAEAAQVLGSVSSSALIELTRLVLQRDAAGLLQQIDRIFKSGAAPALLLQEFVVHWRELLLVKSGGVKLMEELGWSKDEAAELQELVAEATLSDIQDLAQLAREGADMAFRSEYPVYALEALLVRMATREPVLELSDLMSKLKAFLVKEPRGSGGGGGGGLTPPARSEPSAAISSEQGTPPTASASAAASPTAATAPQSPIALDWRGFARYVTQSGEMMLAEHLRRVEVKTFAPGLLELIGPNLSARYLETEVNWRKLCNLLRNFSGSENWQVKVAGDTQNGNRSNGSIMEQEKKKLAQQKAERRATVKESPVVEGILKVFPGSEIKEVDK